MTHPTLRRRTGLVVAGAAALLALGTTAAYAATSVSQTTGLTDGQTITVTGSGLAANTVHKIGLCSDQTYGIAGIPACGEGVEVTTDGSGAFSTSYQLSQSNDNVHATEVPPPLNWGQPATFTCNDTSEPDAVDCDLLITAHPTGGTKSTVGTYAVSFS